MSVPDTMRDPINGMSDPEGVELGYSDLNSNDTRPLAEEEKLDSEWATRCRKWRENKIIKRSLLAIGCLVLLGVIIFLAIYFTTGLPDHQRFYSEAAVASDVGVCSDMGRLAEIVAKYPFLVSDILEKNHGNAVDAAITTLLCLGVVNPESSGLGGGMVMLIYNHKTKAKKAVMALGRAPAAATAGTNDSIEGYKAATIPGELSGMSIAHGVFLGGLPWAELFQPVISLAENGFKVTRHLAMALRMHYGEVKDLDKSKYASILETFANSDGSWKKEGDTVKAPLLARTLRAIANNNASELQTGEMATQLEREIHNNHGIITADDLAGYKANLTKAATFSIGNGRTVLTTPSPSGGPVMQFIINVLRNYGISSANFTSTDERIGIFHRYIEASKFAFALRSYLGDDIHSSKVKKVLSDLRSEDYARKMFSKIRDDRVTYPCSTGYGPVINAASHPGGATHVSIVDENGNAVAATSSINGYFGTGIMGSITGLILNNDMADFDTPASKPGNSANYIGPGKRPLSAMSPVIVINDEGNVEMVAGSSGSNAIIPTNALVVLRSLFTDASLTEIVNDKRIYNELQPENFDKYEYDFSKDVIDGLVNQKHVVDRQSETSTMSVVQAIKKVHSGGYMAFSDPRKQGQAAGY